MKVFFCMFSILVVFSCTEKTTKVDEKITKTTKTEVIAVESNIEFENTIKKFPAQSVPSVDSTNFDNSGAAAVVTSKEIAILQLKGLDQNVSEFKIGKRYLLNDDFISISVLFMKGENEMVTNLITYSKNGKIINHFPIAYDEIAESAFRKESLILSKGIETTDYNYFDEPPSKVKTKTLILPDGNFKTEK